MRIVSLTLRRLAVCLFLATTVGAISPRTSYGQAISVNGGSIQGEVTDSSGAKIANATVLIENRENGFARMEKTDTAGLYSIGPLNPGKYTVTISAAGFSSLKIATVVQTGTATSGNARLSVGGSAETVEVSAGALQVNTEQPGVSDVITTAQIDSLPVNGRNFLDVAQIEPGVILQSGQTFDPTKAGYSAISVGGVSGRTTRILLDGQDITDEFVGTTIFNVSEGSIGEFQLNRANQDVSGDVTSTGQVLVATRSGTNAIHGMAFYNFQDARALFASATPGFAPSPFQRSQFGGSAGGPILRNKLFYFGNYERILQSQQAASNFGTNFTTTSTLTGSSQTTPLSASFPTFPTPYKENYSAGRLDYTGPLGGHYFVRGTDNINGSAAGTQFSLYNNRDNTWGIAAGADYAQGHFSHSFRGSYEKFHNFITDITIGSTGLFDPIQALAINYASQNVHSGPNANAPQATYQSDKQLRYDGSWTHGAHIVRFGASLNRIQAGGTAAFYGFAPRTNPTDSNQLNGTVTSSNPSGFGCNGVPGAAPCLGDILNGYNTSSVTIGNGQGLSSEIPNFGLNGGGTNSWRVASYVADSWKAMPSLTLTGGLRWSVDTNRQNNDLAPPTCADASSTVLAACAGFASTTSLFTLWGAPSGSVKTPYYNFSPQVGLVFSPGDRKTAIRAGFGIFRESDVFNNGSNARSDLLKSGAFFASKNACTNFSVPFPDGSVVTSISASGSINPTDGSGTLLQDLCQNRTIRQSAPYFVALQNAYQASTAANAISSNASFVGNTLSASGLYGPAYRQPYSEQWSFGVQREIFKGGVLSADYVHNSTLRIGQTLDLNHLGAARTFNLANAASAVTTTVAACGGGTLSSVIQPGGCQGLHKGAAASGATISDFAKNGLDSGSVFANATNFNYAGKKNAGAFPGLNQNLGSGAFIQPIGRSGYDALQVVFRGQKSHPIRGVDSGNLQISYNLSRIVSTAGAGTSDQFFTNAVYDKDNPTAFIGRSSNDHKHQINIGGSFNFKYGPQLGIIGHVYSASPTSLTLDTELANGGIFQTDLTGDGTVGDLAPGTNPGAYMHDVKSNTLQSYITNFNSKYAHTLTPAGNAVIASGLFSAAQLTQIGATIQPIANLPQATALNNPAFRSFDVSLSYPIRWISRLREGLALTPGIVFYNVGNFSNFGTFGGVLYDTTTAAGPVYNGTSGITGQNNFVAQSSGHRTLRGSGTFDQGGPRSAEFQLKLDF
jgi:hypothetical protein